MATAEPALEPAQRAEVPFLAQHPPQGEGFAFRFKLALGLARPDLRSPFFWPRSALYGASLVNGAVELAARARDVADLGCGCGWLALEVARRNPGVHLRAIDNDPEALRWAADYYGWLTRKGARLGRVDHLEADLAGHEFEPASLDVAVAFFVVGSMPRPVEFLERVRAALRPGGLLVYYDATEPPGKNLDRLSKWSHRRAKMRGKMSDPWNQRRQLENSYMRDAARAHRPDEAPHENETYGYLLHHFDVLTQKRQRAFVDLMLDKMAPDAALQDLPGLKVLDDLAVRVGYLEGATRFLVGRKPS